jgi:hypothetical protein
MGMRATNDAKPRELIPAKTYFGIICGIFDLGTQSGGNYGAKHQVFIQWELHTKKGPARDSEQRVLRIGSFYTLSFAGKANLRADVEAMLNRSFSEEEAKEGYDVEELLGMACRLQVKHGAKADGTPRDEIGSITALDEDDDAPTAELDHVYFEIEGANCEIPRDVPEWIAGYVKKSPEWTGHASAAPQSRPSRTPSRALAPASVAGAEIDDDDIPF